MKKLTKEEIETKIAKNNYYIASNLERNKLDRVKELEQDNVELKKLLKE